MADLRSCCKMMKGHVTEGGKEGGKEAERERGGAQSQFAHPISNACVKQLRCTCIPNKILSLTGLRIHIWSKWATVRVSRGEVAG